MVASPALAVLRQYLQQQAAKGVTHTRLARAELQRIATLGRSRPVAAAVQPVASVAPPAEPEPAASAADHPMPMSEREQMLAALREEAANCARCRTLGTFRNIMVFAVGNPSAGIMFIGEAPGAEEEKLREPFVGPAGQTLTRIITAMGLKRADVYISNICKYRPAMEEPQGARNRPPTPAEMAACLPYILGEIEIIQPKVIVALGATAATGLGIEGTVGRLRGRFHDLHGTPVMVTYHPSYLLRQEENADKGVGSKRLVWEDMLQVMDKAGLPVSEKQRGFFRQRG